MLGPVLAVHHPFSGSADDRAANRAERCADRSTCQSDNAAGYRASRRRSAHRRMRFSLIRGQADVVALSITAAFVPVHGGLGLQCACRAACEVHWVLSE